MKLEREFYQPLCLMLVAATTLVGMVAGTASSQEVGADQQAVTQEPPHKDTVQQTPADASGSAEASPLEPGVKNASPTDQLAVPKTTTPEEVAVPQKIRGIDEAGQNVLDGMIDGDAKSTVSASVIPEVLTDAEREKLGMNQSRFELPVLVAASTTLPTGQGEGDRHPETFVEQFGQITEPLPETGDQRDADWHWSVCAWAAPNTFSNPKYFEDRMLERHGQESWGCLQPLASGARFFGTVPMLPYLWTVSDPCDCQYTLGYFRSGECVPIMMQRPPYENRAAIVEAGTAAALIIGFP